MSTQTGISTVANILLKELEKRYVYVLDPSSPTFDLPAILLNPAYWKLLTSTQKDTAKTFLKSMVSSSDDIIDTNAMNTHLQSSFKIPKKMNHHVSDSSVSTLYAICWNKKSASPVAPLRWK